MQFVGSAVGIVPRESSVLYLLQSRLFYTHLITMKSVYLWDNYCTVVLLPAEMLSLDCLFVV